MEIIRIVIFHIIADRAAQEFDLVHGDMITMRAVDRDRIAARQPTDGIEPVNLPLQDDAIVPKAEFWTLEREVGELNVAGFAEAPRRQELLRHVDGRIEAHILIDRKRNSGFFGDGYHLLGGLQVYGHRLLHEHGLARPGSVSDNGHASVHGRMEHGAVNEIDVIAAQQLTVVFVNRGDSVEFR